MTGVNAHQSHWALFFTRLHFMLHYWPRSKNVRCYTSNSSSYCHKIILPTSCFNTLTWEMDQQIVWACFLEKLGVNVSLTSRYHPQANSQADDTKQEIWLEWLGQVSSMAWVCPELTVSHWDSAYPISALHSGLPASLTHSHQGPNHGWMVQTQWAGVGTNAKASWVGHTPYQNQCWQALYNPGETSETSLAPQSSHPGMWVPTEVTYELMLPCHSCIPCLPFETSNLQAPSQPPICQSTTSSTTNQHDKQDPRLLSQTRSAGISQDILDPTLLQEFHLPQPHRPIHHPEVTPGEERRGGVTFPDSHCHVWMPPRTLPPCSSSPALPRSRSPDC